MFFLMQPHFPCSQKVLAAAIGGPAPFVPAHWGSCIIHEYSVASVSSASGLQIHSLFMRSRVWLPCFNICFLVAGC